MKVLILVDYFKEEAVKLIPELIKWFSERNILAVVLQRGEEIKSSPKFNFAVLLGGDGFTMRRGQELARDDVPFMTINFGTLGFLTVAKKDNWREVLEKIMEGRYSIERHNLLFVEHQSSGSMRCFEALGNAYIRHQARMVVFDVFADGKVLFENTRGDGVIVANPIGSTAYNLSAGGPVIKEGVVITPICPHPRRLKSKRRKKFKEIKIVYHGVKGPKDEGCLLFIDSDDYPIQPGDQIRISKSSKQASLIIPEGFSFAKARKEKLGLSK